MVATKYVKGMRKRDKMQAITKETLRIRQYEMQKVNMQFLFIHTEYV